jgi:hypothetical protein
MAALTFPIMVAALAGRVSIPASDPNMQYIGRMVSAADGTVQFDMPGCEIRTVMTLTSGTSCPTCSDDAHACHGVPLHVCMLCLCSQWGMCACHLFVLTMRGVIPHCQAQHARRRFRSHLLRFECRGVTCACSNVCACHSLKYCMQ